MITNLKNVCKLAGTVIAKATKFLADARGGIVKRFVRGRGVFVSLPTDSCKFLCYCLLSAVFDELRKVQNSVIVIVSPIIALMMKD